MQIFLPVFRALNAAEVRYIVVGGLAAVLHGYTRLTGDIDLVIELTSTNCSKAIDTLEALSFKPRAPVGMRDFADPDKRASWQREKGLVVFSLYAGTGFPLELDLFVREPLPFGELFAARVIKTIEDVAIPIAAIDHLIALKEATGRARDLEDVAALKLIRGDDGA